MNRDKEGTWTDVTSGVDGRRRKAQPVKKSLRIEENKIGLSVEILTKPMKLFRLTKNATSLHMTQAKHSRKLSLD